MQKSCIVIPCFNESKRLDFKAFSDFLRTSEHIDFLFSNDGSTDNTKELLEDYMIQFPQRVSVHNLLHNSGKAEAVREGILEALKKDKYQFVGFWDADLATPLEEIPYFIESVNRTNKNIGLGSRIKRLGATVERKRSRHLLGRVFSTFASIILKLPVYDTQCGAKIFRSDLKFLFEEKFITSWIFDIELIARYRNKFGISTTLNTIIEIPVNTWTEKGGSKLRLKHMIRIPIELFTVNKKYNHVVKNFF